MYEYRIEKLYGKIVKSYEEKFLEEGITEKI